MTQEQKAKAYDKALERAKQVRKYSSDLAEIKRMEDIFPELEKSEDEKMIKDIMNCVESCYTDEYVQPIRAWLEKQVQKPAGWSEEDERMYQNMLNPSDLRPQSHWKPSQEQMYMLEWLTTNVLDDGVVGNKAKEVLYTLIEQLKSL